MYTKANTEICPPDISETVLCLFLRTVVLSTSIAESHNSVSVKVTVLPHS